MSQSRLPAPPRAASESTNGNGQHESETPTPPNGVSSVAPKSPGEILFDLDNEVSEIRLQSHRLAIAAEATDRKVDALITEQRKLTLWRERMERDQQKRDEVLFSLVEVPQLLAAQARHIVDLQLAVVAVSGKTQELSDRIGAPPTNAIDNGTGLIGKVNKLSVEVRSATAKADAAAKAAESAEDKAEETGKRHVSDLERRASSHEALLTEHAKASLAIEAQRRAQEVELEAKIQAQAAQLAARQAEADLVVATKRRLAIIKVGLAVGLGVPAAIAALWALFKALLGV